MCLKIPPDDTPYYTGCLKSLFDTIAMVGRGSINPSVNKLCPKCPLLPFIRAPPPPCTSLIYYSIHIFLSTPNGQSFCSHFVGESLITFLYTNQVSLFSLISPQIEGKMREKWRLMVKNYRYVNILIFP